MGFTDVGNTTEFLASKSGPFNSRTTWSTNIVPYGNFSVRIPASIIVTIDRSILELNMTFCEINGTLVLGAGNTNFAFQYPTNIIVRAGGFLEDQTTSRSHSSFNPFH